MFKMASKWAGGLAEGKKDPFPYQTESFPPPPLSTQNQALYSETIEPSGWRNSTLYVVSTMQESEHLWSPLTVIGEWDYFL